MFAKHHLTVVINFAHWCGDVDRALNGGGVLIRLPLAFDIVVYKIDSSTKYFLRTESN